jgi:small GTP-binding protein
MTSATSDRFASAQRALTALALALRESSFADKAEAVEAQARRLAAAELSVVVVGEFKRGKSTLINALLGQALLPVAAVPLTAVVTVARRGRETAAFVEFLDGTRRAIPPGTVAEFISEELNPGNEKKVGRVVVETPSPLLERGIALVDTPGVGSVYRHNTEVAERYLPEADAVILVLSADPVIGASEVEFLRSARRWSRRLFVVLNKIDHLDAAELTQAKAFTERVVREALDDPGAELHLLSAKLGLQARQSGDAEADARSGLAAFEAALLVTTEREGRALLVEAATARARQAADAALFEADAALSSAGAEPSAWEEAARRIRARLADIREKQYECSGVYGAKLADLRGEFEKALYAAVREESRRIEAGLEESYALLRDRPAAEFRAGMNKALLDAVESFFTGFLTREEPLWSGRFRELTDGFASRVSELLGEAQDEACDALGAPRRALARPVLGVAAPSVWFVLEPVSIWTGGIQSLPTLRLLKPFFWKALRGRVASVMDVNAGRVRHDYQRRVEKAGEDALAAVREIFQESTLALERAVAEVERRRGESEPAARERRRFWEEGRALVAAARETLARD